MKTYHVTIYTLPTEAVESSADQVSFKLFMEAESPEVILETILESKFYQVPSRKANSGHFVNTKYITEILYSEVTRIAK